MATITNAMAATGVQPKIKEQGTWTLSCTQAIASGAASAQDYKLFPVASGVTITDFYVRFSAAVSTDGFRMGTSSAGTELVSSVACLAACYRAGVTGALTVPYAMSTEGHVYLSLLGASTAASTAYVVMSFDYSEGETN